MHRSLGLEAKVGPRPRRCESRVPPHRHVVHWQSLFGEGGDGHSEQMQEHSGDESVSQTVSEVMDVTIAEHGAILRPSVKKSRSRLVKAMSRHISNAAARFGVTISVDHRP